MRAEYDYSKLRGLIVEKYKTITAFSEVAQMDKGTLSLKLNNKIGFSQDDIVKMMNALQMQKNDVADYFLAIK